MIPEPVTRYLGTTPVARAYWNYSNSAILRLLSIPTSPCPSLPVRMLIKVLACCLLLYPRPHPDVSCVQRSVGINFFLNSNHFSVCVSYHTWLKNPGYILKQLRIDTSLLPSSMGHSKSHSQSRFKGWRSRPHLSVGGEGVTL